MFKRFFDKKKFICAQIILFVFSVFFLNFLAKNTCIVWEDLTQIFVNKSSVFSLYQEADHGCLLSWLAIKLVGSYIPHLFGIHPNENVLGNLLRAIVVSFIPFLISRFALIRKSDSKSAFYYYANAFLLSFVVVSIIPDVYYLLVFYSKNFRYLLMMVFYLIFWLKFIRCFFKTVECSRSTVVVLSILAFIVGLSVEPVNISSVFTLGCFWIYFFVEKRSIQAKIPPFLLFSTILFLVGFAIFYSGPSFWQIAVNERGLSSFNHVIFVVFSSFPQFVFEWFMTVFINEYRWIFSFLIVLFTVLIIRLTQKSPNLNGTGDMEKKSVLVAFFLLFGATFFNFTLIFSGRTYYDGQSFWLKSIDLKLDTSIIFMASLFLLVGIFLSHEGISKIKQKAGRLAFQALVLVLFLIFYGSTKTTIISHFNGYYDSRKLMYQVEKMYVFYSLKNKVALLPETILLDHNLKYTYFGLISEQYSQKDYQGERLPFFKTYYEFIYPSNKFVKIRLVNDLIAIEKFSSLGGNFSKQELKDLNFNKLLDKDFVLNKK